PRGRADQRHPQHGAAPGQRGPKPGRCGRAGRPRTDRRECRMRPEMRPETGTRTPRGSMVDVAGARPDALARAQQRLIAAWLPDRESSRPHSVALAAIGRTAAVCAGSAALTARQASLASHAMAALPSLLLAPISWSEAAGIVSAVARQVQALQAQWIDG